MLSRKTLKTTDKHRKMNENNCVILNEGKNLIKDEMLRDPSLHPWRHWY